MSEENLYSDGNRESGEEQKPEISWEEPTSGIYKEKTVSRQGEYHEKQDAWNQEWRQNKEYHQANENWQNGGYQPVSNGLGIASLVLGILSLALFCSCINIILAVLAIVFGILQLVKKDAPKGMAIAGIVMSVLSMIAFLVFVISLVSSTDFQNGLKRELRNEFGDQFYEEFDSDFFFPDSDLDFYDEDTF